MAGHWLAGLFWGTIAQLSVDVALDQEKGREARPEQIGTTIGSRKTREHGDPSPLSI
jgi:hypothetical protein